MAHMVLLTYLLYKPVISQIDSVLFIFLSGYFLVKCGNCGLRDRMKIKRQKQAKSTISFYKYNFNFREPYQILIDGTFSLAALKNKIQIKEQLPKYLMGEVQLCTTT